MTPKDVTINIRAETSKVKKPRTITIHHIEAVCFRGWMKYRLRFKKSDEHTCGAALHAESARSVSVADSSLPRLGRVVS
jgi:hypothetical protein